jgi:vacuolar-type H+-ATPase subunit I/STV1
MNTPLLYSTLLSTLFVPYNLIAWNGIGTKIINSLCDAIKGIELSVEFTYNWHKNSFKVKQCSLIPHMNNKDSAQTKILRQMLCSSIIQTTDNIKNRDAVLKKLREEAKNIQAATNKLQAETEYLNKKIQEQKRLQKEKDLELIAEINRLKEQLISKF